MLSPEAQDRIRHFVRAAGQKARSLRLEGFEVTEKGPNDYVTNVDRTLDRLIVEQLRAWYPNDGIISEENPRSLEIWRQAHERLWFVDPIDGTSDFIEGKADYSVMLGLLVDSEPVMGWVYAPEYDRTIYGGTGISVGTSSGVFDWEGDREPRSLVVPKTPALTSRVILSEKDERGFGEAIAAAIPGAAFYSIGSFGLKVLDILLGRADLYIYLNRRVKLWDTVGPLAIARAAGLSCCDLEGRTIGFGTDDVDPQTLIHHQPILVGWPERMAQFLPALSRLLGAVIN